MTTHDISTDASVTNIADISRIDKLKYLGLKINVPKKYVSDDQLNALYARVITIPNSKPDKLTDTDNDSNKSTENNIVQTSNNNKSKTKKLPKNISYHKAKTPPIDVHDPKYILVLQFLNAILVQLNKTTIKKITYFKDIRRDELLNDNCKKVMNDYVDQLAVLFGKVYIRYRHRSVINAYIITLIKYCVLACGYNFSSRKTNLSHIVSTRVYELKYVLLYSIC